MNNTLILCGALFLFGCSNTSKPEGQSYLHVNSGVKVIAAVVNNPYPKCLSPNEIARLDKQPELQVFISKKGEVCK